MTSATEVVIFAIACMALNILVGYTGLVSFGHGAWFGLAAYAAGSAAARLAARLVRRCRPCSASLHRRRDRGRLRLPDPAPPRRLFLAADAGAGGHDLCRRLPLDRGDRRRERPWRHRAADVARLQLRDHATITTPGRGDRLPGRDLLWRFHRSPVGNVLVAIRENEQRARFIGYPTNRYKLVAFTLSATLTGLAGILLLFNNRMTSADPISVAFSGESAGHGRDRRHALVPGPGAGRAVLRHLPRLSLGRSTPRTGCSGSACCSSASSCSRPTGWSASPSGCSRRSARRLVEDAAMAGRKIGERAAAGLPEAEVPPRRARAHGRGASSRASAASKPSRASTSPLRDRTLHALIGPNGAGKTTAFNLISGMFPPDPGTYRCWAQPIAGLRRSASRRAGIGRSFQITNLFPALSVGENIRLAVQARHPRRFDLWTNARCRSTRSIPRPPPLIGYLGLAGIENAEAGCCPMAASGCSTWAWRSPPSRACCCSTSRSRASRPPNASASAR